MARCCGSTGGCSCKVSAGRLIEITGTGTAQDPFVIANDAALNAESNEQFTLVLNGTGSTSDPWRLEVLYSPSAELGNVPDVDVAGVTNGQVLAFNTATGMWENQPPAVATPGAVITDSSLDGDGSVGAPLEVVPDTARFIQVSASGVGLTDEGINQLVRVFADSGAQASASPAPDPGTVSLLLDEPGRLYYYTGSTWEYLDNGVSLVVQPGSMLELSGPYAGGRVYDYIDQISVATDGSGDFDVLPAADISAYAGVLSCQFQETGTTGYRVVLRDDTDKIVGRAFRLTDGTVLAGFTAEGTVRALLY